jgi:excinuclease ABC subunit B
MDFKLTTSFTLQGDQRQAVEQLAVGVKQGLSHQVLLGVTGSGKTFTVACVVEKIAKPTLVIAHNKTLAAQLYQEFKEFFPYNAVEYFVSYYDYYQPEAYVPQSDLYIEKEVLINEEIDRLRLAATRSLFERKDVLIVASVSCIYGLGSPDTFFSMHVFLENGTEFKRDDLLHHLVELQYERIHGELYRGAMRIRGDKIELFPAYEEFPIRIMLRHNRVESIDEFDAITGRKTRNLPKVLIFPRTHYVTPMRRLNTALTSIRKELNDRYEELVLMKKNIEAQRLQQRTLYDMELLKATGYCHSIENYSRHLDGRAPGSPPATLIDYFPKDYLLIIDESHVTVPQIRGMYEGDRSRKQTLVDFGFRLPSARDNRPLNFAEFESRVNQVIYVSATPAEYEMRKSDYRVIEQIIRPTGLMEPKVTLRPSKFQIDDILEQIRKRMEINERVLITTLTKKMAEELTDYLCECGVRAQYLHSEIDTLERVKILRDLRLGVFDVLVGVNLLREGLDLPEVSLVAIVDADKEGFLRSATSLIQTMGRAARNINGEVILYADTVTDSMRYAMNECERRRSIQEQYNTKHHITPSSIKKEIRDVLTSVYEKDYYTVPLAAESQETYSIEQLDTIIKNLENEMYQASEKLEYEKAIIIRDKIKRLKKQYIQ